MKINSKGFNLTELMIVITLIGIIAAIAIPQYKKTRENKTIEITYSYDNSSGTIPKSADAYSGDNLIAHAFVQLSERKAGANVSLEEEHYNLDGRLVYTGLVEIQLTPGEDKVVSESSWRGKKELNIFKSWPFGCSPLAKTEKIEISRGEEKTGVTYSYDDDFSKIMAKAAEAHFGGNLIADATVQSSKIKYGVTQVRLYVRHYYMDRRVYSGLVDIKFTTEGDMVVGQTYLFGEKESDIFISWPFSCRAIVKIEQILE